MATGDVVMDAALHNKNANPPSSLQVSLQSLSALNAQATGHSDYGNADEEALKWAALERLPTFDRLKTAIIAKALEDGTIGHAEVDVKSLSTAERTKLVERVLETHDQDNSYILRKLRDRLDRVGLKFPTVDVKFDNVSVEAKVYVGSRALPTLPNFARNMAESILAKMKILPDKRRVFPILHNVRGVLKPGRMTLLLGPPGAGKSTLMKFLAGQMDEELKVTGSVTYNGHTLDEFIPVRTAAYVSQNDVHIGEMTVRETLDFSTRVQGPGFKGEMARELQRREKEAGIKPDPAMDAFMKAQSIEGNPTNIITDYMMKILGLDICADTLVGNEMIRGISGGQKKRVTTGELVVGPKQVLFMDEISTGLDSSTTFLITKCLSNFTHIQDATVLIALLQPAPETYDLFDDILLLSEGHVVYHGPREEVVAFFENLGFRCPPRKGIADFLQEVTSVKDQQQYWYRMSPYTFISVSAMSKAFEATSHGRSITTSLQTPFDKEKSPPGALIHEKYGLPKLPLFKAVFEREILLMKRNAFLYIALTVQMIVIAFIMSTVFFRTELSQNVNDGSLYLGALFFGLVIILFNGFGEMSLLVDRLPVFYKQRNMLLFPAWSWSIPMWVLSMAFSAWASFIWTAITYYIVGFSPQAGRFFAQWLAFFCLHQMGIGFFRVIAAIARTMVLANTFGAFAIIICFLLGGFVIAKNTIHPYWIWGFWISPVAYIQNCFAVNEFLAERWQKPADQFLYPGQTIGEVVLHSRDLFHHSYMYWVGIAANIGYIIFFNILAMVCLQTFGPLGRPQPLISEDIIEAKHTARTGESLARIGESGRKSRSISRQQSRLAGNPSALDKYRVNKATASSRIEYLKSTGNTPQVSSLNERITDDLEARAIADATMAEIGEASTKGMVLPFTPLALTFHNTNYFVDMPAEMKTPGGDTRLQLLKNVSGAFRPGVLTALVGVSGAGKTTLMDVLAGRKTGGYIEGDIRVSGYPKVQETFSRIMGYCEQNDIHSPQVTVHESLLYSAWLRLPVDVDQATREEFVDEVMELVELGPLQEALVGLPGITGLSTEQRKRLTIAVELVANPSIIFMDEPTSGLDARAAAIVMRTVRNTVDTGRTVVCTIHQPSIDIFEAFDELLLMKRGGEVIYMGPLGKNSHFLVEYFEAVPGVPKIKDGYNPATWMLEVSSPAAAERLNLDFAEIFRNSEQFQNNEKMIEELSVPPEGHVDLSFPTKFSTSFPTQLWACIWKRQKMYWRTPEYNVVRYFYTAFMALIIGSIFFGLGVKRRAQQNVLNVMGALYTASLFIGWNNGASVQPIIAIERTVFYRERAAGYYSAIPYALAQGLIEIPYVAVQTVVYSLIVYALIHFEWTAAKFFWFLIYAFLTLLYFTYYGMMAISITPNEQLSMVVSVFFFGLWNLFSGFLIPRKSLPPWWKWYYYLNPVAWTLYGLIASQMGDVDTPLKQIGVYPDASVKEYLNSYFGYHHNMLGWIICILCGFTILFFSVFAIALERLNFQKR